MKVYTKTGDEGTTSLVGGTRIAKNDIRLDAYGTVDELNSWLGFLLSFGISDTGTSEFIVRLQHWLFDLGCILASERDSTIPTAFSTDQPVTAVENEIDRMEEVLPRHNKFILPGGTQPSCCAGIARTVCRRAERIMVSLPPDSYPAQDVATKFINRLSDYLFVLSRFLNYSTGTQEVFWNTKK